MSNLDLESVIEDAVSDAELPEETPEVGVEASDTSDSTEVEATAEETPETSEESVGLEVSSPANRQAKPEQDDFEKKFGIPAKSDSGRENRIPHSRVQKMVAKAQKEVEDKFAPKLQEWETKWSEQEVRNQKVAEFENVMVNDPSRFIKTLHDNLPQYRDLLAPIYAPKPVQQADEAVAAQEVDGMPGPDFENPDGSRVYSEKGLKGLIDWAISQGETRAVKTLEQRYAPIEQSFQRYQFEQQAAKKVSEQLAKARTWPLFTENEEEIAKLVQANREITLEDAYHQVVFPKFQADRNKMREELLAELKKAPSSTSAPRATNRSTPVQSSGPKNLEDVIRGAVDGANLR